MHFLCVCGHKIECVCSLAAKVSELMCKKLQRNQGKREPDDKGTNPPKCQEKILISAINNINKWFIFNKI